MDTITIGIGGYTDLNPRFSCYQVVGRRLVVDCAIAQLDPFRTTAVPDTEAGPACEYGRVSETGELTHDGEGWVGNATRRIRSWFDGTAHEIQVEGIGAFSVSGDGGAIVLLEAAEPVDDALVVETLLGPVLILALAIGDVFCLHASAVERDGRALLFLGESGAGKSTMASSLQDAGPMRRLTDDISPVRYSIDRFQILPDFPQLKLSGSDQLPGENQFESLEVEAIYSLNRTLPGQAEDPAITRRRCGPAESFARLTGQGVASRIFTDDLLRCLSRQTATLASIVPVYELTYPSGTEYFGSTLAFLMAQDG